MKTMRAAALAACAAAAALGGCQTMRETRARIVQPPARCTDQTVAIYFEPESADVSPEGRAVIGAAARMARPCQVRSVEVLGLADAAGAPDANLELSKRRAASVSQALAAAGLPPAAFTVEAAGQAGSVTRGGKVAPLRRRADVVLHLEPSARGGGATAGPAQGRRGAGVQGASGRKERSRSLGTGSKVCIIEKRGAETADWHGRQSQVGGGVAASASLRTHRRRMRSATRPIIFQKNLARGGRLRRTGEGH